MERVTANDRRLSGLTTTVADAAAVLGIDRNAAYRAVRRGDIRAIRIGGKIVIPTLPLRRMLGMDTENAA
jgi:excisionase family DNA binding protein